MLSKIKHKIRYALSARYREDCQYRLAIQKSCEDSYPYWSDGQIEEYFAVKAATYKALMRR